MSESRREQIHTMEFWQMVSATLLVLIVYLTTPESYQFWTHSLSLGLFLMLRWFRFREEFSLQFVDDREDFFNHLWLLDSFLLSWAAVETSTINLLLFAALGVTFSPLIKEFADEVEQRRRNLSRAMATTVAFFVLSLFWGSHDVTLSPMREGLILMAGLGTLWINIQLIEDKQTDKRTNSSLAVTERLFFHDLINHTHSILLGVEAKGENSPMGQMVSEEIKKLQILIQDHYKYHHKNLKGLKLYFKASELEVEARKLFENYLPSPDWNLHWVSDLHFDGHLPAAQFIRIITNIAKNMAESHAMEAEIHFVTSPDKLTIKTRNRISREYLDPESSPWNHHVLNDRFRDLGSGLKSVNKQCLALKGNFQFSVEGEYWVNKLTLPLQSRDYSTLDKKAA